MVLTCSVSVRSFKGIPPQGLTPDWFAGERQEALLGEHREMPLWALDSQFASEIFLVGALQEGGMRSEAKRKGQRSPHKWLVTLGWSQQSLFVTCGCRNSAWSELNKDSLPPNLS